jgi:NAD(P)-dependent dehydrogenase (short-subunit alcohol dehydrogenase family)
MSSRRRREADVGAGRAAAADATAVVTGGTAGIGLEVAAALAGAASGGLL